MEFGAAKKNDSAILILDDWQVNKVAECLPRIFESMFGNEQYGCKEGNFRLNTTGSYKIASLYLDKHYISRTLVGLNYLSKIFHVVQREMNVYTLSLSDVLAYVTVALTSDNYVERAPNASKYIMCSQLFEEMKTTYKKKYCTLCINEIKYCKKQHSRLILLALIHN